MGCGIGPTYRCAVIDRERRRLFEYEYYRHWHRWKPVDSVGEDAAHSRHEARDPYAVLAMAPCMGSRKYIASIKFQGAQIALTMLDDNYRDYLTCQFEVRDNGKIFLSAATHRAYRGKCDSIAITEDYTFREEGTVLFEKRHFQDGVLALRTGKMDVVWNWENYPSFGDYDTLLEIRWVCNLGEI